MLRLPLIRAGKPYFSLDTKVVTDVRDGSAVVEVSQAIPGIIARDLGRAEENRQALEQKSTSELLAVCHRAAELFRDADLPLYPGAEQRLGPEDYLERLASTTGMPMAMGRMNLLKIHSVLSDIEGVLDGLTRGLDLSVLDGGWGSQGGRRLSYQRLTDNLGAILPNNSPGVHNLWLPAIPLKVPLVLKPGGSEPWTPYRLAMALLEAGCPPEAISLYPAGHGAVSELLLKTGRSMFFGDASTVEAWQGSGKVQLHGPGWSKVIFGADQADQWQPHLDLLVSSVAANGGRSCINCSSVWTPSSGLELATAMAEQLAKFEARPLDHENAQLAAFPDPAVARAISEMIDQQLEIPGAVDVTAQFRSGGRVAEAGGCTFLLPTLIHCTDPEHPLASAEFIFPFGVVVDCPADECFERIGPTLIGTVITDDAATRDQALDCRLIDRLNLGPIPTYQISWDQPHEGNLFDHLYHQRAFQLAS